jgi:UTP--glucose-1-phosphate uridylyltransferase
LGDQPYGLVERASRDLVQQFTVVKQGHRGNRRSDPDDAPSNWILIGRYVCDPAVFDVLRETQPGRGGEIQLTDALKVLAQRDPADGNGGGLQGGGVHGVLFRGRRYDTGNKIDYLRTLVQFACERSDLAEEIVPWLRKYVDSLP